MSNLISESHNAGDAGDYTLNAEFEAAEKVILRWESSSESGRVWEESPSECTKYLRAVDVIIQFREDLAVRSLENDKVMVDRAETVVQLAMSRLEDEFRQIMIRNTLSFSSEGLHISSRDASPSVTSNDAEIGDFESFKNDKQASPFIHERAVSLGDDLLIDMVQPHALVELRKISDRMIKSGYEKECCQVYSSVRRDVLDECLLILGIERLSIEEVQRIEWRKLDDKMKKWVQAIKIVVRVFLSGEKRFCEQIFGDISDDSELIKEVCFVETAKGCVMQLLNFGEAVVASRRTSEKLFRTLDMYDALASILPNLTELFSDKSGELVCSEAKGVLTGLGDAAIGTLVEFENAVRGETSRRQIQGGDIHPMCRYVMNYVKLLLEYRDVLDSLLESNNVEESDQSQSDGNEVHNVHIEKMSPLPHRLPLLITILISNLEAKSKLYDDNAMRYIFLMNNILYIVQKVKDSEIRTFLGDQWIRNFRVQIRQHATSYLRAAWSKVLSCLRDEGIGGSLSNASKMALKERFKKFNACFEDVYRIQTAWKVPDAQLREELRISISEKVIPAYRAFTGRFRNQLERSSHVRKYIKYTPEDLENYLSDLFEGTQ